MEIGGVNYSKKFNRGGVGVGVGVEWGWGWSGGGVGFGGCKVWHEELNTKTS